MPPKARKQKRVVSRTARTDQAIELLADAIDTLKGSKPKVAMPNVVWRSGSLEVDLRKLTVTQEGRTVTLTWKEFQVLRRLIEANGAAVNRDDLWSPHEKHLPNTSRSLDAHIWSIRKKLEERPTEPGHIVTVTRFGYRLV